MVKVKINPLTIAVLLISATTMALYAYQNFKADQSGYGIVFVLLCILLLGLAIHGLIRNHGIKKTGNSES